jgi:hypothetical protein
MGPFEMFQSPGPPPNFLERRRESDRMLRRLESTPTKSWMNSVSQKKNEKTCEMPV